ncbi:MAG: Ig-like domain-containing protein, partial [Heliobacteriaceae bacterium]|nr:Ig-like domain-containing protein [Heliobacteriaceae bacterium]
SLANHAWHDRIETHPDGSCLTGELTYSDGKWRDQRTVPHTYRDEDRQSTIEITYEINRKPVIKAIQPNQALGRYTYQDEENYQRATHFVAGKDTVIQVFLPDELKPDQATALELDVYCNGSKVATLTGPKKDSKHNALIFVPKDKATCGNWAPGAYRFVARLDEREKTLDGVEFETRRDMRILAVPVTANYNGTIKDPGANWTKADQFLRRVFPLADENVKFELGAPMDASGSRYNLATKDGCTWLWLKLRDLQPPRYAGGQYDAIVGFIPEPIPIYTDGELTAYQLGFTVRKPAAIVALGNRDYQTTLAHEIAHFFDVGDEYAGGAFNPAVNPPPGGYAGKDWHTGAPVTSPAGTVKPATSGSGSLIPAKLHPYETGGRGLLGDSMSFMGSGAPPAKNWVTPDIWKHLFGAFAPPAAAQGFRLLSAAPANLAVKASGLINAAGEVQTLPWFSYTAGTPVTPQTGSHQITALDAGGAVLATQGFTPDTRGLTNPPQVLAHQVFSVEVPLPAGTSRLEIREGDRVLKEIPVSAGSPTITITRPATGAGLTGTVTLAWTAGDPDGDALSFKVEYSPDGSRWIVLEPATEFTEFTADFSRLPGGDQPAIRVTATDGINSTAAVSTGFVSPVKDPAVFIDTPGDGYYLFAGEGVSLEGRAYDPQTGWIYAADHLVWHSDRDGELGRGSLVYANQLGSGTHVITLTATGPAGQTVTKSVNVTVNPAGSGIPQDVGEQADVPVDHIWTVTFNSPVDPATLTPANIRVLDAAGNPADVNVVPGVDGKSALISPPPGGYLPGQSYIIIVGEGVKSATGTGLRSAYMKRFRT